MVKKVCRYNGQLVQVQWTFGQNHEIILSTVLAFDCIPINILSELVLKTCTFAKKYDALGNFGQNIF